MVKVNFNKRSNANEADGVLHRFDVDAVTEVENVQWDAVLARVVERCPNLTTVNQLSSRVTDAGVVALAQGCPNLTTVYLPSSVTDAGVVALAQGCPNLTTVNLPSGVTDAGVAALAQGCPKLTTVDLSYCNQVTDAGVVALAQGRPNLTAVSLNSCKQVTDAGVVALAQGCPNLTTVNLSYCNQVTDAGVVALAQGCPSLTTVNLNGCNKVTKFGRAALARGCPLLPSSADTIIETQALDISIVPAPAPLSHAVVATLIENDPSLGLHTVLQINAVSIEVVQDAVAQGADLSMLSRGGRTLLHSHALAPNPSAQPVAWLMGEGLNPFALDDDGRLPYALAPQNAPPAFAVPLLDWIRVNGDGSEEVVDSVNKATIVLFVALRAAPSVTFSVPTLAFLINAGADINALEPVLGQRPLHIAASHAIPELVVALLAAGADPWALNAHNAAAYVDVSARKQTTNTQATVALLTGATPVPAPFAAHVKDQIEAGGGGLAGPSNAGGPSPLEALEARFAAAEQRHAAEMAELKAELAATKDELRMTTIKADSAVDAYRKFEERIKDQLDAFRAHLSRRK